MVMELVKLVIVSHKRAETIKSHKSFANAVVCIPESQEADYRRYNPSLNIYTHPDTVKGLAAKYIWCYKEFGNVALIGDDIDFLRRNWVADAKDKKSRIDPETAYEIIQSTAYTAKQMGAKLFAFSKESNPVAYSGQRPFKVSGLASGGVIGLLDGFKMELTTDCVAGLDYFLSGLNAYYHRYLFVDERYFTQCKEGTFVSRGGMAEFRTMETEEKDLLMLRNLFGDAIIIKKNANLRRLKHKFDKTLKIPF